MVRSETGREPESSDQVCDLLWGDEEQMDEEVFPQTVHVMAVFLQTLAS